MGLVAYAEGESKVFLGRAATQHKQISDDPASIDRLIIKLAGEIGRSNHAAILS